MAMNLWSICSWAKGENDSRKTEIANLDNFAHSENDARKNEIANLDNFAKSENDGRKQVKFDNSFLRLMFFHISEKMISQQL